MSLETPPKALSLKLDAYFRERFCGTNKRREAAPSLGSAQPVCERGEQNRYQKTTGMAPKSSRYEEKPASFLPCVFVGHDGC